MAKSKGHGGARPGAGRKPKFDEEELLDLLGEAWPKQERIKAFKALVNRAGLGDLEALKLLMAYSYGKPKDKQEPSPEPPSIPLPILEAINKIYGKPTV